MLRDDDPMPFGKAFKGTPMRFVTADYLNWIWHNVPEDKCPDVHEYIRSRLNSLKMEKRDLIWSK